MTGAQPTTGRKPISRTFVVLVLVGALAGGAFGMVWFVQTETAKADNRVKEMQAALDAKSKELDAAQQRATKAIEEAAKATKAADEANANSKKVEELFAKVNELRREGFSVPPLHHYERKAPPPLPEGFRAEVTDVAGELFTINAGLDAGLAVGMEFAVFRPDDGGKFLGMAKVTSPLNLFPKQAIVTFIPARKIPLDKVPLADLPRKGDQVRAPEALDGKR